MMATSVGSSCRNSGSLLGRRYIQGRPTVSVFTRGLIAPSDSYYLRGAKDHTKRTTVTVLPCNGVGPELCSAAIGVLNAVQAPLDFETFADVADGVEFPVITSIARNQVCLKGGPWVSDSDEEGVRNKNVVLRQALNLYCNVVPIKSIPGIKTRHDNIDIVVVRENTEAEYSGLEQEVSPGVVQSLKVVTRTASLRIAEAAFAYAVQNNRKSVAAIHKANIQKLTDGLFLESCREVAKKYPGIEYREVIIDNTCMQLVMKPQQFDVMVTPNLYGNLVINVASALVGGPGLVGGVNWGLRGEAIFEPGARHAARDLAGQGIANPAGIILSSAMLLRHLQLHDKADRVERALYSVLKEEKYRTKDVGGSAPTKVMTQAIIDRL